MKQSPSTSKASLLKTLKKKDQEIGILRNILAIMPGNLYWKDKNNRTLGSNKHMAKILGFNAPHDLIGLNLYEILTSLDQNLSTGTIQKTDKEILKTGLEKSYEECGYDIHHRPAVYLTRKAPLYDAKQNIHGIISISLDITDRKKMEQSLILAKEQAETANIAKSTFIANMNHDLKTPLSGILGLSEILTHRLQGKNLKLAQTLLLASQQLYSFVDQCLNLSNTEHIEKNQLFSEVTCFNIKKMMNDLDALFQPLIQKKSLIMQINYDQLTSALLIGHQWCLYRILLNLISNAVKFTHNGSITIHLASQKMANEAILIKIIIKDTGIGIAAKDQQTIFDQFTRLTPAYHGLYEGSGMGLYIVKKLIQHIHGKISVKSAVGKGSVFTIHLPFQTQQIKEVAPKPPLLDSTQCAISPSRKQRLKYQTDHALSILLVEDNHIAQQTISALLSSFQCKPILAETGEAALKLFKPGRYDLIIIDIGLPNMQGDMVAKKIREKENNSVFKVPIIALTAHATTAERKQHAACGIKKTYSKPLLRHQIATLIQNIIKKQKSV